MTTLNTTWRKRLIPACALGLLLAGCTRDGRYQPIGMWNESRLKPLETRMAALVPPAGTIARGEPARHDPVYTGRSGGRLVTASPVPITPAVLQRGQERYNIYCSPCHSRLGDGEGMIVKRGFPHPPDYAIPRLREAPIGHFYDVITNGYGVMYSYAERVEVPDRWAISAYIRVLQESRPVVPEDRYEEERVRAREQGILDPTRGMRLPDTRGPQQEFTEPRRGETPVTPRVGEPSSGH